jgi:GGDEF domain-containing protein
MTESRSWNSDEMAAALRRLHDSVTSLAQSSLDNRKATPAARTGMEADREVVSVDELIGPYRPGRVFPQIEWEMSRARRREQPCALAFVKVDGLGLGGHEAHYRMSDQALLRLVAETLRSMLRHYDCIVRFGDAEFLCAIVGLTMQTATSRFQLIKSMVAVKPAPASVTVELEMMRTNDSLNDLTIRRELAARHQRRQTRI